MTRVSLLARATRLPARSAARVASSPAAPTTALTTMSASGCVAASTSTSGPLGQPPVAARPGQAGVGRPPLGHLRAASSSRFRPAGERHDPEMLALAAEHVERAPADRAGGAEDGDARAGRSSPLIRSPRRAGRSRPRPARRSRASRSRSSTPPWPGIRWLESFTPGLALEQRFGKVADLPHDRQHAGDDQQPATAGSRVRPRETRGAEERRHERARRPRRRRAPERVFPGLIAGASLGPPRARPPNMAAVSQTQVTTSGKEHQPGAGPGALRVLAVPDAEQESRQRAGVEHRERVTPTASSGRSAGARAASAQVSSPRSQRATGVGPACQHQLARRREPTSAA